MKCKDMLYQVSNLQQERAFYHSLGQTHNRRQMLNHEYSKKLWIEFRMIVYASYINFNITELADKHQF